MSAPRRRGRPKSAATIEKEKIAGMLRNYPDHLPRMTEAEKKEAADGLAHLEEIRLSILKDYKTSVNIPDSHAYAMASLGDESLIGFEELILEQHAAFQEQAHTNRETGAYAVRTNAIDRALSLCGRNRVLLQRLKPLGPLTLNDVASKILREWEIVHPDALLPGEPRSLTKRGIDGEPPTTRTIKNYIRAASPHTEQRVGKTSERKK